MTILDRLLNEMEVQGKKATELNHFLGINSSSFSTWKKFKRNPPAEYISRICEFLNVSSDWLLTGQGTKSRTATPPPIGMWELQEYQRQAINDTLSNLTEEQALLLDNYEKLTPPNKREVRGIIQLKLESQMDDAHTGRTEKSLA